MITTAKQSLMEVTGALSRCARAAGFTFGSDTVLVAVQHMLYQTVDLFRALGEVGLEPENIFALGKVYSNNVAVIGVLRNMGVTVVESLVARPGEFYDAFAADVTRLWKTVTENLARRHVRRIIVLDDGGQCVTNIPPELLSRYPVAGVEQTSLGMFVFEENPPPFAVFSWARTAVKLQIGGHVFSHCLIERLESEFLNGKPLKGAEIGIIGLGSIGKSLADITSRQGNSVAFYDPAPDLNIPDYLRERITRCDSLEELMMRSEYVFGASGRNPFKDRWPMAHRPGIKLFSGSGGDQEFGPIIRCLQSRSDFKVARHTWDITSESGPSGPIRIAFLGYPYNFVSRSEAAVPTRIVQLETAGLLAGLMEARSYLDSVEAGHEQDVRIHRISPDAQKFIYEAWRVAMENRGIDIRALYGHDPALLAATRSIDWLAANSEPRPVQSTASVERVEKALRVMLDQCCQQAH